MNIIADLGSISRLSLFSVAFDELAVNFVQGWVRDNKESEYVGLESKRGTENSKSRKNFLIYFRIQSSSMHALS